MASNHKSLQTVQLMPSGKEIKEGKAIHISTREELKARLWMHGIIEKPNDAELMKGSRLRIDLPVYQFDFQRCWINKRDTVFSNGQSDLLIKMFRNGMDELSELSKDNLSALLEKLLNPVREIAGRDTTEREIEILEHDYTDAEYRMAKIFSEILGLNQLSVHDDFFKIGGNSIRAIQLAHRISKEFDSDVKVADVFRLKSIRQLIKGLGSERGLNLIKPFYSKYNPNLADMIFIHPGAGGSEVYQDLADLLAENFNCLGIDNYNIHHKDKIGSLNKLANLYLSNVEQKYKINEPINLAGWSLGGRIALEIAAILELRGYKNINVVLLDSQVPDNFIREVFKKEDVELYYRQFKDYLLQEGYEPEYAEKVVSALKPEFELFYCKNDYILKYSKVKLFRAIQEDLRVTNKYSKLKHEHFMTLKANYVESLTQDLDVINIDCHHGNILEEKNIQIIKKHLLLSESLNLMLNRVIEA